MGPLLKVYVHYLKETKREKYKRLFATINSLNCNEPFYFYKQELVFCRNQKILGFDPDARLYFPVTMYLYLVVLDYVKSMHDNNTL